MTAILSPFGTGGGGTGTVTSVAAADTSIVVTGTPTIAPTLATGTLDVIAADHPPAANWSNNGFRITNQAAAQVSGDSIALGPWQFTPEASGAKGDGQLISDAAITSGAAILTTVGVVNASTAPTFNHAATGGTVLAGTYQAKYTYATPFGETTASSSASTTSSGSTSTLTVTAPALVPGGAIGYHVYITAAGGSTFFRQTKAGLPYPFTNNFVLFAPPLTSTPQPPVSNTTTSAPFAAGDAGKSVRVIGAGAAGADLITTILSFQSSGQVTLNANASTTVSPSGFVWGTDDTAAVQTWLDALQTQAGLNSAATAEGICRPVIYILATAPVVSTARDANAVTFLPNPPNGAPKQKIAIRGQSQDVSTLPVYQQTWPETSGTTFMYIGANGTNNGTYGAAHVFGTPTNGNVYVTESGDKPGTANMKMVFDSIRCVTPYKSGVGGFDLFSSAESDNRSCSTQALAIVPAGGSWAQMATTGPSAQQFGWGLREPGAGNNAQSYTEQFTSEGICYGYGPSEHLVAVDVFCAYNVTGVESYAGNGISMVHNGHIVSAGVELCTNGVGAFDGGVKLDIDNLRTESLSKQVFDPSNRLQGTFGLRCQGTTGTYNAAFLNSATGVSLINLMSSPGALAGAATGDPGPPATTVAWVNYYYRHALVTATLAGGTFTTLNVGAVAQAAAVGVAVFTFLLPAGQSYTPTYGAGALTHQITLI